MEKTGVLECSHISHQLDDHQHRGKPGDSVVYWGYETAPVHQIAGRSRAPEGFRSLIFCASIQSCTAVVVGRC